ncbi:hypothetical protein TNIN_373081 [Trichonephila inaurata madagascariensis]|uniref:Uncharacterized protein n=1 Tax=Trichonephila inaurata madagascariensis TaxID=2747483 RepID=A0A8X6YCK2_9ARAC|nr:hypothetical protein TNIN_373081 [Trichonephila inaurata madagascariensis]
MAIQAQNDLKTADCHLKIEYNTSVLSGCLYLRALLRRIHVIFIGKMVFFVCSSCGSCLKKNQVENHLAYKCRNSKCVSCMDCLKEFCHTPKIRCRAELHSDEVRQNRGRKNWFCINRVSGVTWGMLETNLFARFDVDVVMSFISI